MFLSEFALSPLKFPLISDKINVLECVKVNKVKLFYLYLIYKWILIFKFSKILCNL